MKHLVIGDIHSNHKALRKIITNYSPEEYQYIFLGDYNDYREDNPRENSNYIEVIETIISLVKKFSAIALLGNHDDKLIRYLNGNKVETKEGFNNTMYDLENSIIKDQIFNFLKNRPLFHECKINNINYKFAHAINPEDNEIFSRKNESTSKEWKSLKDHAIWGYPRRLDDNGKYHRILYWEEEKYHDRIPKNTIKVAGHYHTIYQDEHFIILDASPNIATYLIEDDLIEVWNKE